MRLLLCCISLGVECMYGSLCVVCMYGALCVVCMCGSLRVVCIYGSLCVVCMYGSLFVLFQFQNPIKLTTPIGDVLILFVISNFHSFFIVPHLIIVTILST